MKGLIKSGMCLTLLWLAGPAGAQEAQWKKFTPITSETPAASTPGIRPVSLSAPVALRPSSETTGAVIRAQAEDKGIPPLPVLSPETTQLVQPKPMPKEGKEGKEFIAPKPAPYSVVPLPNESPWNSMSPGPALGMMDGCCSGGVGRKFRCFDDGCCPDRGRGWVSAEYLMWWQRADSVPPLVTASPAGTPLAQAGVLGAPTTTVLYDSVPNHTRGGGRFDAGWWFGHFPNLGIEVNYLFLGRQNDTATFASNGDPQLSRPFFNVNPAVGAPRQFAEQVANANLAGAVKVDHFSQLWGIEGNLRHKWLCSQNYWLDCIVGYRHLNLSEGIDITENLVTRPDGIGFLVQDSFHTRTEFNGVQVGLDGEWRFAERWSLGSTVKFAMGSSHQILNIDGSTTVSNLPLGFAQFNGTQKGGLYALSTNIGRYTQNHFAVLPEVSLKIGYNVTENLRLFVGYDFLYLSSVIRPGEQINQNVNPAFLPPAPFFGNPAAGANAGIRQPAVLFRTSDYWAQGLNFGLLYRF